jgi:peptide/nickel transport system substrate-binding protein
VALAGEIEFRILGSFEVVSDGRAITLGPGKERALLGVLLLCRNERVSIDRLVDLLWDERPPESASKMVQIYVSRLRRRLEPNERLITQAAGYRLRVDPDELDLDRFERLAADGRDALAAGDADLAAAGLREALLLWRGPPLADVADGHFLEQERARLEDLRLGALEERIEAELALGGGPALLDELQALVRQHPLRERPSAQLMLALYRSGRQAEALATFKGVRNRLVEELGIEPGRPLKDLQQAILRQDPSLDAPPRGKPAPARERVSERRPKHLPQRSVVMAIAAVVAIAAAIATAVALSGNGSGRVRLAADAVGLVRDGRIVDQARVGAAPSAIAAGAGEIWVASAGTNAVSRLDPKTLAVRQTIPVGNGPSGIALARGALWVTNGLDGTLSRIDLKANKVVQTIHVGNGPAAIAYGLGSLWVANRIDQTVSQIDPRTGNVLDTLGAGTDAAAIAAGDGAVWVVDQAHGKVARLQPGFTEPVAISVGNGPSAIALGSGSVWVANALDSTVTRIDPRSDRVIATILVGAGPSSLAVAADGIWVGTEQDGTLLRIDPKTNRVDRKIRLDQRPKASASTSTGVLVAVGPSAASHRGGTLRLDASAFPYGSIDPTNSGPPSAIELTNDGLIGFRRVGGVEGTQLVPDLAASLPAPTDGGTTYAFMVRRGIRYSDGRLVRPEDFRRALRRSFIIAHDAFYYSAIVGANECAATPRRCDLSRGIAVDDHAWAVTFHLKAPDPDFLFKLALPFADAVPAGTPDKDVGRRPVPATGPYQIASYRPGRLLELLRNAHFHVWSNAAQPAGYPDRIIWRLGVDPAAEVAAVESGKTDVAFDGVPPKRLAEVTTQYASRVRESPTPRTTFAFLNTRVPPFDDVRVRRAVSYAADRSAFVRALGGPDRAQPTCKVLPPNFPGYRPYCRFTLRPGPAGVWSEPDLPKARRLIAASGTRGAKVTVWIPANRRPEGRLLVTLLSQLGYRTRPKYVGSGSPAYARMAEPRLRIQAGVLSWVADFPAASDFIAFFFTCRGRTVGAGYNPSQFCDRRIDAQIKHALALEATDPVIAASLWSQLDREIVDRAPMVPLVNPKEVDFLSSRVGNYEYNPQLGMLLDQLWVR